jgi:hypothetical protein
MKRSTMIDLALGALLLAAGAFAWDRWRNLTDELARYKATASGYEMATASAGMPRGYRTIVLPAGTIAPCSSARKVFIGFEETGR